MKRLLFILAIVLWTSAGNAQSPNGMLKRYKDGMRLDGRILSLQEQGAILSDIGGKDYTSEWLRYSHWREEGQKCIIAGTVITSIGTGALLGIGAAYIGGLFGVVFPLAVFAASESVQILNDYDSAFAPWFIGSGAVAAAGAATFLTGVTILVVNNRRMSAICDKYNESCITLQIGLTHSGAGLALLF